MGEIDTYWCIFLLGLKYNLVKNISKVRKKNACFRKCGWPEKSSTGGRKFIFFQSGDFVFDFFVFSFFLLVCFLKWKVYLLNARSAIRGVRDKNFCLADFRKQDYPFLATWLKHDRWLLKFKNQQEPNGIKIFKQL